jgi:UDP-N-acetyl-2-amino-2-deoxyglucuronate dehydrogenase
MTNYKFAIIGCGQIAGRHAEQIQKNGQLVAVCDIIPEKADSFSQKFPSKPYYNIDELLSKEKNSDLVVVCSPNGLHAEHSINSLQAGKHVLCEKPMAISTADARKMIDAEKKTGKKLFVVKQNRFNPPVVYLKKLVDENKLGKIFSFQLNCFWNRPKAYYQNTWRGTKDLDGGTLFTQFSHFIDLLYWLLGDLTEASGVRHNFLHNNSIEFEDAGVAQLQMKNGSIGTINYTINSNNKNMEGSLTLFGEKGTVKIGGQYLNELEYFSVEGESFPELPRGNPANQYGYYEGSMSNHHKVYEHLIKALDDPFYNFINSEETFKTIEIIEKIYNSSPLLT